MDKPGGDIQDAHILLKRFTPKSSNKVLPPFLHLWPQKFFASLFSLPTIPSVCKILAVSQFGSLSPVAVYRTETDLHFHLLFMVSIISLVIHGLPSKVLLVPSSYYSGLECTGDGFTTFPDCWCLQQLPPQWSVVSSLPFLAWLLLPAGNVAYPAAVRLSSRKKSHYQWKMRWDIIRRTLLVFCPDP